jgi:hypothetical protein
MTKHLQHVLFWRITTHLTCFQTLRIIKWIRHVCLVLRSQLVMMMVVGLKYSPNPQLDPLIPSLVSTFCVCLAFCIKHVKSTTDINEANRRTPISFLHSSFHFFARHVCAMVARKILQFHSKFYSSGLHYPTSLWRRRPRLRISTDPFLKYSLQ